MSGVESYGGDLARRLYQRYSSKYDVQARAILDELMREDAVVALVDFLFDGLEHEDLQPDEVAEAIELARADKLLKSSAWLLEHLTEYQKRVLHVA